jgi:hypothetical protein
MALNPDIFSKSAQACKLPANCSKVPDGYAIQTTSVTAPTASTISLALVASGVSLFLRKGFILKFGASLIVLKQSVTLTNVASVVQINARPSGALSIASGAVHSSSATVQTAVNALTSYVPELYPILSTTDLSVNFADGTVDITDQRSGLQGQMIKVGFDLNLPISFRLRCDDNAIHKILVPAQKSNEQIFFVHSQADYTSCAYLTYGTAIVSALNTTAPVKNIVTGTVSLLTQPPTAIITNPYTLSAAAQAQYAEDAVMFGIPVRPSVQVI